MTEKLTWARFQNGASSAMASVAAEQSDPMIIILSEVSNTCSIKPLTLGPAEHCVCVCVCVHTRVYLISCTPNCYDDSIVMLQSFKYDF